MVFVTGDTHGSETVGKLDNIAIAYPHLTKEDYVIVAGDFGGCWNSSEERALKERMKRLPYTLLFVDGNHENFVRLSQYPLEKWKGGRVRRLLPDVLFLMRGQIFEIEEMTFLTLGGAESDDKEKRREGISWWEEESVTYRDVEEALKNISAHSGRVDYIISHTLPSDFLYHPLFADRARRRQNVSEMLLNVVYHNVKFRHWYFGHWHTDARISPSFTALFREFVLLPERSE